jgi:hypothetical protein
LYILINIWNFLNFSLIFSSKDIPKLLGLSMKSKLLFYSSLIGLSLQAHAIDLEVYAGKDNKPTNIEAKNNWLVKKYFDETNLGIKAYTDPLPHNIQMGIGIDRSTTNTHFGFEKITASSAQIKYLRLSAYSLNLQALWKPMKHLGVNLSTGPVYRAHTMGIEGQAEQTISLMGLITRFEVSGEYPINDWTLTLAVGVESENIKGPLINGNGGSELAVIDHAPMQYGASLGVRYTLPWPNSKPKNNSGLDERYEAPKAETPVWDEDDNEVKATEPLETKTPKVTNSISEQQAIKEQAARDAEVAAWEEEDRLEREAKEAKRIAREEAWQKSQREEALKKQNSELSEDNDYQWD